MPDSRPMNAEPAMQHSFSYVHHFSALFLLLSVAGGDWLIGRTPDRHELGPGMAELRFEPVALDPRGFGPLRLAGAWRLTSDDRRVGGLSALALSGNALVALSDSGVVVRFAAPGPGGGVRRAEIRELPFGPGNRHFKRHRDSEALTADPAGRGWWVAFESHHELWLFDHAFDRPLRRLRLPAHGWRANRGVEGLAAADGALLLFPEPGGWLLRLAGERLTGQRLVGSHRRLSAAAALPDGDLLVVERRPTLLGFDNRLARLASDGHGYRRAGWTRLGLGRLDNVEGLAVERREGGVRLWLITDDSHQRPFRTLLVALDVR